MVSRRSSTVKRIVFAILGALLYCEWFIYHAQPMFWTPIKCPSGDSSCTKILFIADPQIQGDNAVPPPLNYLFNWDSDRYLKNTFSIVMKFFKPDILVYMGDLMDEGSISTTYQYEKYLERLADIFTVDDSIMQIWIPGDNDIGGEGEQVKENKVAAFEKAFSQPRVVSYRNISFYKVSGIMHKFPKDVKDSHDFKIVISHYPITVKHAFGEMVNNAIRPNIYFCAHEHKSKYIKQNAQLTFRETFQLRYGDDILNITFPDDSLYEIYVPTCSYRMGTNKIGFGAAILEKNIRNMRYTVFWSPQRFPYLFFYLMLFICIIVYFCVFCTVKFCHKQSSLKKFVKSDEKVPFLERIATP